MVNLQKLLVRMSLVAAGLGARGIVVSILVLMLVGFIIIPLPTHVLDVFLVANIVLALIVLLRALSVSDPVRLFSFPTVLLFATLFRLALNVSSTRLILLRGHDEQLEAAGEVIGSFGSFAVGGEMVVGSIVFLLIAVVNFVVIAKGSARVAEVAARFVLDSMPGKQLAIDAEARAGIITSEEAASRRQELTRESQFYGAMDGAMKFVQGDAIAGLVIVFINAVGGLIIGTVQKGMALNDALGVYGVLAIGDGLVNIVPSLLMSLSAGVIVTHVGGSAERGSAGEMFTQLVADPTALFMSAGALLVAGTLPGLPLLPFSFVAFLLIVVGAGLRYLALQGGGTLPFEVTLLEGEGEGQAKLPTAGTRPQIGWGESADRHGGVAGKRDTKEPALEPELLTLEVDARIWSAVLRASAGAADKLNADFSDLAARLQRERGVSLPPLVLREATLSQPGEYRVFVREQIVRSGVLPAGHLFLTATSSSLAVFGVQAAGNGRHPLDSRTGEWVSAKAAGLDAFRRLGADLLSLEQYLLYEVVGAAFHVVDEIFGLDEVKGLVQGLRERHKMLVEEIFDKGVLSFAELTELLRRLVREHVSIRDLKLILEGVSEFASSQGVDQEDRREWLNELHAFLRVVLHRTILRDALGAGEKLRVFVLSEEVEEEFRSILTVWESRRSGPPLDPELQSQLKENAKKMFHPVLERGNLPVVLVCAGDIRQAVQEFFHRQLSASDWIRTLAYQELDGGYRPESIGVLGV
ncbi:MAG: flagellar biosynthesis protein FlhA [Bdellovibrionota bacterium]